MDLEALLQKRAELDALIVKAEKAKKIGAEVASALVSADVIELGTEKIVGAALYLRANPQIEAEVLKLAEAALPKKRGRKSEPASGAK